MSIKIISENRKARFNFHITETFEAGLVLTGSEIKSLRKNGCSLNESYVSEKNNELYMQKSHIAPYLASSYNNHEPERLRKLLLSRHEMQKILTALAEKGMACIPLKIYFKGGFAKVEVGLAKGKKIGDKRETIKTRDVNRELQRTLRKSKR